MFFAVFEEYDMVAYLHNRVHIMRIDNRTHIILLSQFVYQLVNHNTGLRV